MHREIRAFVLRQLGQLVDATEEHEDPELRDEVLEMVANFLLLLDAPHQREPLSPLLH